MMRTLLPARSASSKSRACYTVCVDMWHKSIYHVRYGSKSCRSCRKYLLEEPSDVVRVIAVDWLVLLLPRPQDQLGVHDAVLGQPGALRDGAHGVGGLWRVEVEHALDA